MGRRGRARTNSRRERDGRKQRDRRADLGSDFALKRKMELVGPGGDPAKAENVLDVLCATGYLTEAQAKAGQSFAAAWWGQTTKPFAKVPALPVRTPDTEPRPLPTLTDEEREALFLKQRGRLKDAGSAAYDAVINAAVLDRLPAWWWRARHGRARQGDEAKVKALHRGLDALAR